MLFQSMVSKEREEFERRLLSKQRYAQHSIRDAFVKSPITGEEESLINMDIASLVKERRDGKYAFKKLRGDTHRKTNAFSEVGVPNRPFHRNYLKGKWEPLHNIPVSLDDQFFVMDTYSSGGYFRYSNEKCIFTKPRSTAKLLEDAGALTGSKANVPITMMSLVGFNDIFGQSSNFHNAKFSTGGSSGASLIAGKSVKAGIGTDIWGGVRVPASWNGVYSLKMSSFRWPMAGTSCGYEGITGIRPVASPLAQNIKDLRYFIESVFSVCPWKYDNDVIPHEWRDVKLPKWPRVGVMVLDDFLPPTPAQARALQFTKDALFMGSCKTVDFKPPSPSVEYDELIHKLYYADGFKKITEILMPFEHNDPHVANVAKYSKLPRFLQVLWEKILSLFGYKELERMYRCQRSFSAAEYSDLITMRDRFRKEFSDAWEKAEIDFLITLVHPSPAVPLGTEDTFWTILYTSLFNLLDYPAGVVPVSTVDKDLDKLPLDFDRSTLSYPAQVLFDVYDPVEMEGLPTAIQVVTKRFENEEALSAMEIVVDSLEKARALYK